MTTGVLATLTLVATRPPCNRSILANRLQVGLIITNDDVTAVIDALRAERFAGLANARHRKLIVAKTLSTMIYLIHQDLSPNPLLVDTPNANP